MCSRLRLLALCSFLWFFSAEAFSQDLALETNDTTTSKPDISYLNPDGTPNWQALEAASELLSQKANEAADSADKLQSLLVESQTQYTQLLKLSKEADQIAKQAMLARRLESSAWRSIALVASGSLIGLVSPFYTLYGVGVGGAIAIAWIGFDLARGLLWSFQ